MFVVIYRGYLKPSYEHEYCAAWKTVANYFIKHRGSLGSSLHKAEDGMWLAYSRWPDKKTRDASWGDHANNDFPDEVKSAITTLKNCIDTDRELPEIQLDMVEDLL